MTARPTRYFIGLALPAHATSALHAISERLNYARWNRPDTFHITVGYMGEAAPDRARAAFGRLRDGPLDFAPLTIGGLGLFPNRPEAVVFNRVTRTPALDAMRRRTDQALVDQGFPPWQHPEFNPHVTQAVFEDLDANRYVLEHMLQRHARFRLVAEPTALALFASRRARGVIVHDVLDSIPAR